MDMKFWFLRFSGFRFFSDHDGQTPREKYKFWYGHELLRLVEL